VIPFPLGLKVAAVRAVQQILVSVRMGIKKVDIGAHELVSRVHDLPTLPTVIGRINAEMEKESLTAASLAATVSEDSSLASMVLKIANSAYYGLVKEVDTVERAITVLGMETVRSLAMGLSAFALFEKDPTGVMDLEGLWHHTLACAVAAARILKGTGLQDRGFLSGLLHDIGKVVMAHILPDETIMVIGQMRDTGMRQSAVEEDAFGFSHARIGGILADKWHFPELYGRAIRFHHDPSRLSANKSDPETVKVLAAVHVANKMVKLLGLGVSTDPQSDRVDQGCFRLLGLDRDAMKGMAGGIRKDFAAMLEVWS